MVQRVMITKLHYPLHLPSKTEQKNRFPLIIEKTASFWVNHYPLRTQNTQISDKQQIYFFLFTVKVTENLT